MLTIDNYVANNVCKFILKKVKTMNDIFVLTREELETLDYSVFMHIPVTFHAHKIKKYLDGIAESSGNPKEKKLASLFGMLYSFNLQVVNNTPSFEPQMIWGNKRSILPEDFDEQVNDCLLYVSQKITNPFLLSRIYDVVWCNNRKNKDVAIKAIDSYAEMLNIAIEKLIIKNESMDESDLNCFIFARDYIARALHINKMVYPRKSEGNMAIKNAIHSLYSIQNERLIFEGFNNLTWFMVRDFDGYNLQYAENAEKMAEQHKDKKYYDAVKSLYMTSAVIYEKNGEYERAKRCKLASANITIKVATDRPDNMGKISWLRTAISELRQYGGDSQQIEDLKEQLANLREEVRSEYVTLSHSIDISDLVAESEKKLTGRSLPDIFKVLMRETPIENIESMREQVLRLSEKSLFSSFVGTEINDESGRKVYTIPPLNNKKDMSDDVVIDQYLRNFEITHKIFVNGVFEPARYVLSQEHGLTLSTFVKLVTTSPIVKPEFREIFNLGFYKLWQGDYISAAYLLIPQMEGMVRYYYELSGKDATRYLDKGLEESTSISQLLDKCRDDLESIFSKNLVLTIDVLFNRKSGATLRHKLAHGNLYTNACYDETTTYACILIFFLCAYPLLPYFDTVFEQGSV